MEYTLFYTKYSNNQPCIKTLNFLRSKSLSMQEFQMFDVRDIPRHEVPSWLKRVPTLYVHSQQEIYEGYNEIASSFMSKQSSQETNNSPSLSEQILTKVEGEVKGESIQTTFSGVDIDENVPSLADQILTRVEVVDNSTNESFDDALKKRLAERNNQL